MTDPAELSGLETMAEGDTAAAAARFSLCRSVLLEGEPLLLRIRGSSMAPALWSGEWVTVGPVDRKSAKIGQIAVFFRNGQFIAHRIVVAAGSETPRARNPAVVTRGDAAIEQDSPVLDSEWLGVVVNVHRFGAPRAVPLQPSAAARVVAAIIRRSDFARRAADRLGRQLARRPEAS